MSRHLHIFMSICTYRDSRIMHIQLYLMTAGTEHIGFSGTATEIVSVTLYHILNSCFFYQPNGTANAFPRYFPVGKVCLKKAFWIFDISEWPAICRPFGKYSVSFWHPEHIYESAHPKAVHGESAEEVRGRSTNRGRHAFIACKPPIPPMCCARCERIGECLEKRKTEWWKLKTEKRALHVTTTTHPCLCIY